MSYYDRKTTRIDGREAFANDDDRANEEDVRAAVEAAWDVKLKRYGGHFDAIDFYAIRDGKVAAHLEVKSRTHPTWKYPTVFLNERKWHSLLTTWLYTRLPSIFVVRFEDEIRWIDIRDVDARTIRLGGCSRVVKAKSDVEPVIEVPVEQMHVLKRNGEDK